MPRPATKKSLIELSNKYFTDLIHLINALPSEKQNVTFPAGTLNRNIRDVLAHLHHWHLLMLGWYKEGMNGNKPEMPAKGHTWKTTPELNKEIQIMYNSTPLSKVKKMLQESFNEIQMIITAHTDSELFEKKKYEWTGTTSLGAYLVSATSSHYEWALKLISKALKEK